jgi:hypothetical protein
MENVAREAAVGTSEGTYLPEDTLALIMSAYLVIRHTIYCAAVLASSSG